MLHLRLSFLLPLPRVCVGVCAILVALIPRPASAFGPVVFPEFVVNELVDLSEQNPSVAGTPDGGSVVAWFAFERFGFGRDTNILRLRLLGPDGAPLGLDRNVASVPLATYGKAALAVAPGGEITVFWTEQLLGFTETYYVMARLFSPSGEPLEPARIIFTSSVRIFSPVVAVTNGGVYLTWVENGLLPRVALARTDFSGTFKEPERYFGGGEEPYEHWPTVATSRDGRAMLATQRKGDCSGCTELVVRIFEDGSLEPALERVLDSDHLGPNFRASVTALGAHHFAVAWRRYGGTGQPNDLLTTVVRSDGELISERVSLLPEDSTESPLDPRIAGDGNGQMLVTWDTVGPVAPKLGGGELRYRAFDFAGGPRSSVEQLNTFDLSREDSPTVAATAAGRFIAAWQSGNEAGCILPCSFDGLDGTRASVVGRRVELTTPLLVLQQGRFFLNLTWTDALGVRRLATAEALTGDTGYFHFGNPDNVELVVKVLDGRAVNGHFWIFVGGLTNVEYELLVVDTEELKNRRYFSEQGRLASFADTRLFADEVPVAGELPLGRSPILVPGLVDSCAAGALCLNEERFEVTVSWFDPRTATSGVGHPVKLTADTGYFWFFRDANVELTLKVLDGRPVNGHFWVFYAGLSDVQYTIEVRDRQTGEVKRYLNLAFDLASVADTAAF